MTLTTQPVIYLLFYLPMILIFFCSGKDLEELEMLIHDELAHVQEWLMLNKLTVNGKNQISLQVFKSHNRKLKTHLSLKLNNARVC